MSDFRKLDIYMVDIISVKLMSGMAMNPEPSAIPNDAHTHTVAAEVNPLTRNFDMNMVPAPKNPTPDTTCAAIRVGSP